MFSPAIPPIQYVAIIAGVVGALCVMAYWKKVLSWDGSVVAFAVGIIIAIFGSLMWFLLLFILLLSSFIATKYKFSIKVAKGVQEGKRGERRAKNVISHAVVPCALAFANFYSGAIPFFTDSTADILFIAAIAAAGADTIASEMGVLSDRVRLITTGKKVKAGTDGGISAFGTFWALIAAGYISVLGWLMVSVDYTSLLNRPWLLLIPLTAGFLGCNIDSVIGATLERRGAIGKHANNLASITIAVLAAMLVLVWLGI